MKLLFIITLLLVGCSCGSEEEPVAEVSPTIHVGIVTGLSVDINDKKHFEMLDEHGMTVSAQYCATTLERGDSIKYTTPATNKKDDLGVIVHYGKGH